MPLNPVFKEADPEEADVSFALPDESEGIDHRGAVAEEERGREKVVGLEPLPQKLALRDRQAECW